MQHQVVTVDRLPQLAEQGQALRTVLVQLGGIDRIAVARALRDVHRHVGVAQQGGRVLAMRRVHGDADARTDVQVVLVDREAWL